jgi:hypothetical protein
MMSHQKCSRSAVISNQDSGFVFNAIHNMLAETSPEEIITMYKAALGGAIL